ncbi:MAG: hypothetical protein DME39_06840 [Verrucomicrobia bacterium]|nr:MAG: hypothetical protein DME39_06840 [Verrucomicrobiota bacterium]
MSTQAKSEILAFVLDVKLLVSALFALTIDVFLYASRNISSAYAFLGTTRFRVFPAFLWLLRGLFRMLRMLLGTDPRYR